MLGGKGRGRELVLGVRLNVCNSTRIARILGLEHGEVGGDG